MLCHATVGTLSVDKLLVFSFFDLLNQLSEGSQLSRVDKVELIDEIYEVLKTSIQVRLRWKKHYVLEVRVVDVSVNSK